MHHQIRKVSTGFQIANRSDRAEIKNFADLATPSKIRLNSVDLATLSKNPPEFRLVSNFIKYSLEFYLSATQFYNFLIFNNRRRRREGATATSINAIRISISK